MGKYIRRRLPTCYEFLHDATLRQVYKYSRSDPDDFQLRSAVRYHLEKYDVEHPDPLAEPLTNGWRHVLDFCGGCDAHGRDYRILPDDPDDPWTEEELTDYVESSEVYCPLPPYDWSPTGRKYTEHWTHNRTPAGIVIIHYWALDT